MTSIQSSNPSSALSRLGQLAFNGDVEGLSNSLATGADPNAPVSSDWRTALHVAFEGYNEKQYTSLERLHSICKKLIDSGADPKLATESGVTALHYAAAIGDVVLIDLLIDKGADINCLAGQSTPLAFAVRLAPLPTIEHLIKRGADVEAMAFGSSLVDLAKDRAYSSESVGRHIDSIISKHYEQSGRPSPGRCQACGSEKQEVYTLRVVDVQVESSKHAEQNSIKVNGWRLKFGAHIPLTLCQDCFLEQQIMLRRRVLKLLPYYIVGFLLAAGVTAVGIHNIDDGLGIFGMVAGGIACLVIVCVFLASLDKTSAKAGIHSPAFAELLKKNLKMDKVNLINLFGMTFGEIYSVEIISDYGLIPGLPGSRFFIYESGIQSECERRRRQTGWSILRCTQTRQKLGDMEKKDYPISVGSAAQVLGCPDNLGGWLDNM